MESFLTTISRLIQEKSLPALMIGGHAVTALGHPRATFDLDLLIPRSSAPLWKAALRNLRYRLFAESENFHQFEAHPSLPLPPIDLMLVSDETFQTLELTKIPSTPIATPGVLAMIALKLHATQQPTRQSSAERDWSDILALIHAHQLTLDDSDFAATIHKHGGKIATQRIQTALLGGN